MPLCTQIRDMKYSEHDVRALHECTPSENFQLSQARHMGAWARLCVVYGGGCSAALSYRRSIIIAGAQDALIGNADAR